MVHLILHMNGTSLVSYKPAALVTLQEQEKRALALEWVEPGDPVALGIKYKGLESDR